MTSKKITNHFVTAATARRYARSRHYHHPLAIDKVRRFLKRTKPVTLALDVGCGTGMSAVALKTISARVVAVDPSAAMLAQAPRADRLHYVTARAEALPFAGSSFDLVTVSSAFHWFDRPLFLAEAARVLAPRGWLVIYNSGFRARMRENPAFEKAFRAAYPKRFPAPIKHWEPLSKTDARPHGLDFRHTEHFESPVSLTPTMLVNGLVTHSNVIAAVEERGESLRAVRKWIFGLVRPLFSGPRGTFSFRGAIWFVQKTGPSKRSLRRQKKLNKPGAAVRKRKSK